MGFFASLFGKSPPEPDAPVRDHSKLAPPDPLTEAGRAPYIDAWVGYAPSKAQGAVGLYTIGRNRNETVVSGDATPPIADSVAGQYPGTGQFDAEKMMYSVAPPQTQVEWQRAPDPRWQGTPPIRPQRAPTSYRAVNPFDWQHAHRLNGTHFSMASNIRTYPIGGMQPAIPRRNTFRLMPPPRDLNSVNLPANRTGFDIDDADIRSVSIGPRSPVKVLR